MKIEGSSTVRVFTFIMQVCQNQYHNHIVKAFVSHVYDVLYTDVWVSMGEPVEVWAERINDLAAYQINQQLMDIAGPHAVFMHCLPAFHDHKTTVGKEMGERFGRDAMEVTDEVFEGPRASCLTRPRTGCTPSRP